MPRSAPLGSSCLLRFDYCCCGCTLTQGIQIFAFFSILEACYDLYEAAINLSIAGGETYYLQSGLANLVYAALNSCGGIFGLLGVSQRDYKRVQIYYNTTLTVICMNVFFTILAFATIVEDYLWIAIYAIVPFLAIHVLAGYYQMCILLSYIEAVQQPPRIQPVVAVQAVVVQPAVMAVAPMGGVVAQPAMGVVVAQPAGVPPTYAQAAPSYGQAIASPPVKAV
jgi:hypothetical protein